MRCLLVLVLLTTSAFAQTSHWEAVPPASATHVSAPAPTPIRFHAKPSVYDATGDLESGAAVTWGTPAAQPHYTAPNTVTIPTPAKITPIPEPIKQIKQPEPVRQLEQAKQFEQVEKVKNTERVEIVKIVEQDPRYRELLPHVQRCGVVLIQADFPISEMESVTREIALLQEDLLLYLAVPAPREKIDLCLFASYKSYRQFLDRLFPNAPTDRPALFIKRPGEPATLLVQRAAHFEIDLRHEMTHAILHASIDDVPMWLDEGLAKYLELPREERPYGSPYLSTVKWQTSWWMTSSLRRLESLRDVNEMETREYRDSWAWIHFLIHYSPETHQMLANYLQYLATVSNKPKPLSVYLDAKLESSRGAMKLHFSRWQAPEAVAHKPPTKWRLF